MKPRFGRLEQVRLNDIWNGEGHEFLPWLAKPDNLSMIGEVLGQNLSVERHEKGPEPQAAFLLCRDLGSGMWVLIENPVTTTEYSQLGSMLAHASQFNPANVLWMAGVVQEDHRRLLEWLNGSMDDQVNLFALEIGFWRIGDSPFAPNFDLVAAPQAWGRDNGATAGSPVAPPFEQSRQTSEPAGPVPAAEPMRHPDQRSEPPASGLFAKRIAEAEVSDRPPTPRRTPASEPGPPGREPQTPSGLLRAAAARPQQEREPQRPSGLFQMNAATQPGDERPARGASDPFQRQDAPGSHESDPQTPSGMLGKAAANREDESSQGIFGSPPFEGEMNGGADEGRHPTLVSYDDEPAADIGRHPTMVSYDDQPAGDTSPSLAMPDHGADWEMNDEPPDSGLLKKWQSSEATITPSGMLNRVEVSGQPGEASNLGRRGVASDLDPTQQIYLEFWTKFWEEVVQWESELPPERPMAQGWVTFPVGREDFYLVAFVNADHKLAGMGLVLEGPNSKLHFHQLHREKDAIEAEFGYMLDWRELPTKEESHIYLHKRDVDPNDRPRWREYHKWFAEALETFTHVLGTRVRALDTGGNTAEENLFKSG